jgi:hypothetical protein
MVTLPYFKLKLRTEEAYHVQVVLDPIEVMDLSGMIPIGGTVARVLKSHGGLQCGSSLQIIIPVVTDEEDVPLGVPCYRAEDVPGFTHMACILHHSEEGDAGYYGETEAIFGPTDHPYMEIPPAWTLWRPVWRLRVFWWNLTSDQTIRYY